MALKFGSNSDDVNTLVYANQDVKVLKQGSTVVWSKPIQIEIKSCTYGSITATLTAGTNSEPQPSSTQAGARVNLSYATTIGACAKGFYGDYLRLYGHSGGDSNYVYNFTDNSSFKAQCYKNNTAVGAVWYLNPSNEVYINYNPTLDWNKIKLDLTYERKPAIWTFTTTQTGSTSGYANKRLGCSTSSAYTDNTYPTSPQTFTGSRYKNQSVYGYITLQYGGYVLGWDDVGQVVIQGQMCHVWRTHLGTTMSWDNANTSQVFNAQVYHLGTKLKDSSVTSSAQNFNTALASAAGYQVDDYFLIDVQITGLTCNGTSMGDIYVTLPYSHYQKTVQSGNYKLVFTFLNNGTNIVVQTSQQNTGGGSYQVKFNYKVYAMIQ